MSQYTQQDTIEETGINILRNTLDPEFFLINDFTAGAGKDKYPDIDGQIRLRDGNGNYLNKYFHYQLKSKKYIKNIKYFCNQKTLKYLTDTNVPTLLFIVDTGLKKAFWYFLDSKTKKTLRLKQNNKGRTLDLSNREMNNNSHKLNIEWQEIAKPDDYDQLNKSLNKIVSDFHANVTKCVGLLYLLQKASKNELPELFNKILKIDIDEVKVIINRLNKEGIINSTVNLYLIDNEQLGKESLLELLPALDLYSLEAIFLDIKERAAIFQQLAGIMNPKVDSYLIYLSIEIFMLCKEATNNDDILVNLELLNKFAFRVPKTVVDIIRAIIDIKNPLEPTIHEHVGGVQWKGKSHVDLVVKCIELLDTILYLKIESVFPLLIRLATNQENRIQFKAKEVLNHLSRYNLYVLEQIGYYPQELILGKIKSWNNKKMAQSIEVLLEIINQLLQPSFEGVSSDYKSVTFRQGPLSVNDRLKSIRSRSIDLLNKLYSISTNLTHKARILQVMEEAAQTPIQGNYGDDMEKMVLDDTNTIINYYIKIVPEAENRIVRDIDKQTYNFIRRHKKEGLPRLDQLQKIIASNREYEMFNIFVGYEYKFDEEVNWEKADKLRRDKIQDFIDDVSDNNWDKWQKRILSVRKNYSPNDMGEFQYFNIFLYELGKQKSGFALWLIEKNENDLEPFLVHLVAGLWKSRFKTNAEDIVSAWADQNKHLRICASIFEYVEEIDLRLMKNIFKIAVENKDLDALNYLTGSIARNYFKDKSLTQLFVKLIKELTKNNDSRWVNIIWFRKE